MNSDYSDKKKMKHLDLFAGIGGFSLAARWMGWETVAQVEWDGWCQKVLAKNLPDALRFGDIVEFNKMLQNGKITTDTGLFGQKIGKEQTTGIKQYCEEIDSNTDRAGIHQEEKHTTKERINALGTIERNREMAIHLGRIDIITGGFPCQPFSHAGKRKGTSDNRWLWPAMLTTIRILKPRFVVGENVAGLVSMENGKTLDRILSDLENEGYTVESFIIPACAVGAWHRRDRIWITAYANTPGNAVAGQNRESNQTKRAGKTFDESIRGGQFPTIQYEGLDDISRDVANSNNKRLQRGQETGNIRRIRKNGNKLFERHSELTGGTYWFSEPELGRVANGIPNRVDRLKGLGNAIVPQVIFEIFRAIEQYDFRIQTSQAHLKEDR